MVIGSPIGLTEKLQVIDKDLVFFLYQHQKSGTFRLKKREVDGAGGGKGSLSSSDQNFPRNADNGTNKVNIIKT